MSKTQSHDTMTAQIRILADAELDRVSGGTQEDPYLDENGGRPWCSTFDRIVRWLQGRQAGSLN